MRSPWSFWPKPITPCACQLDTRCLYPPSFDQALACKRQLPLEQVCGPKAADVFSLNNPGLEGARSFGLAPLFLPIFNLAKKSGAIFILALMIVALSARQRQSIEKQKTHRKVFWHPGLKQSLLLVFTVSSGMLLTGCGREEYTSLEEAQNGVCSSPPCP